MTSDVRPHVLFVPSSYPSSDRPHAGIFFADQALALAEAGHQIGVIVPRVAGYRAALRRLAGNGATVRRDSAGVVVFERGVLALWPKSRRSRQAAFLSAGRLLLDEYIREVGKPDVLHAHVGLPAGVLAADLSAVHGIPYVITEHSTQVFQDKLSLWERRQVSRVYSGAGSAIAVSEAFRSALSSRFPRSDGWITIPNVVAPDFLRAKLATGSAEIVFLSVGGLVPRKGFDIMLEAFALVAGRLPTARLRVVGEGCDRAALGRLAAGLGVEGKVTFLGALPRALVMDEMSTATCFVSASRAETFGVAIIEAMAMGLPVVATHCGGPEENVGADAGRIVPPGDSEALAAAMMEVVSWDAGDRPGRRASCERRFGGRAIANQLGAVYASICKGGVAG